MAVTIVVQPGGSHSNYAARLEAIAAHVDFARDRVLLVTPSDQEHADLARAFLDNDHRVDRLDVPPDCPVSQTIEHALADDTTGNHAVLIIGDAVLTAGAIEELLEVLNLNEKHGIAFPRSNAPGIAAVPLLPLGAAHSSLESIDVYERLQPHLRRFTPTPVSTGPCVLIRRELIEDYGLGDAFALTSGGQHEFSLRVNQFGYSAVMANGAFVVASEPQDWESILSVSASDGSFAFVHDAIEDYVHYLADPVDRFADRLFGRGRAKVLIDLQQLDSLYNGSSRNALGFIAALAAQRAELDAEIVISSRPETVAAFALESYGFRILTSTGADETFDLGFLLAPTTDRDHVLALNKNCVRWVISFLDVISLRVVELLEVDFTRRQVILDGLNFSDRVLAISAATLDDAEALLGGELDDLRERATVVHLGVPTGELSGLPDERGLSDDANRTIDDGGYVLVIGNDYPHKRLLETVRALAAIDRPVIVFGPRKSAGFERPGVTLVQGGHVSDHVLDRIYRNAACAIYPSSYEGFGLPPIESAVRGIPVVLYDTAISREVVDAFQMSPLAHFFRDFRQLPAVVNSAANAGPVEPPPGMRTLLDYNEELIRQLVHELNSPVDLAALRRRVSHFRSVEAYSAASERALWATLNSRSVRVSQVVMHVLSRIRGIGARTRKS